jgi:hypothetical protein
MCALASFVIALFAVILPFNRMLVSFPLPLIISMLLLIISLTIYFNVRDKFWAGVVEEKSKGRKKSSAR